MQMDPQKTPQTVYFKRFGAFEHIFGVERGAGRPAGADARTDARTHAGPASDPPPTRTGKKYAVRGTPPSLRCNSTK